MNYEEIRAKYNKEEKLFNRRVWFIGIGFWIVFHIFGLIVLFTVKPMANGSGPIGGAIFIDSVGLTFCVLWFLSKIFIRNKDK